MSLSGVKRTSCKHGASRTLWNATNVNTYLVHTCAGYNIKRLVVSIAEGDVSDKLRHLDMTESFALRRNNPNAARSGLPDISFDVDLHSVRYARSGVIVQVDEQSTVSQRVVRLDVISSNKTLATSVRIQDLFIG